MSDDTDDKEEQWMQMKKVNQKLDVHTVLFLCYAAEETSSDWIHNT